MVEMGQERGWQEPWRTWRPESLVVKLNRDKRQDQFSWSRGWAGLGASCECEDTEGRGSCQATKRPDTHLTPANGSKEAGGGLSTDIYVRACMEHININ